MATASMLVTLPPVSNSFPIPSTRVDFPPPKTYAVPQVYVNFDASRSDIERIVELNSLALILFKIMLFIS